MLRVIAILAMTLSAFSALRPERADAADDPTAAHFGGSREAFEKKYGDPISDPVEENGITRVDYAIEGFKQVTAGYDDDYIVKLYLSPASGDWWTAEQLAVVLKDFAPTDAEISDERHHLDEELDWEQVALNGHSDGVGENIDANTYEEVGARGKPGDFVVVLRDIGDESYLDVQFAIGKVGDDGDSEDAKDDALSGRCVPVDQALLDGIASGLEGGVTLVNGRAVRSNDFSEAYFIAAEMNGPGMGGEIGVWVSNSLVLGEGLIMAVNNLAQEFSQWPDADSTAAQITMSDDGAAEAEDCVEALE